MSTLIRFRSKNRSTLSRFDLTLNLAVAALLAIGTLLVYAATREWFRSNNLDPEYYLKRHILNILIGALLAYGTTLIDYRLLRAYAPILWLISIIGLIAVFIPGIGEEVNNSNAWISLPGGFQLQPAELAKIATVMVEAGIDLIKDDHSLANQKWATWNERVKIISDSVNEANAKFNRNSVYAPSMNRPTDQILDAALKAKELGCGAVLVLPGISGLDTTRVIADCDEFALPIMSHPANLGSYIMNPNHGLNHEIVLSTFKRISGADMSIFPNFAGRFSFSKEECLTIANSCREELGNLK